MPTVVATAAAPMPSECKSARRLTLLREEMSASLNVMRSTRQILEAQKLQSRHGILRGAAGKAKLVSATPQEKALSRVMLPHEQSFP
jgi:hypothetical protein